MAPGRPWDQFPPRSPQGGRPAGGRRVVRAQRPSSGPALVGAPPHPDGARLPAQAHPMVERELAVLAAAVPSDELAPTAATSATSRTVPEPGSPAGPVGTERGAAARGLTP